jgi:hypothetical protein
MSSFDAEPYIQDIYNNSLSIRRTPYMAQSAGIDVTKDAFRRGKKSNFIPSSASSVGSWEDYIAWDSLRSPLTTQSGWLPQTSQGSSNAPLFSETSDGWKRIGEPGSFTPSTFPNPGSDVKLLECTLSSRNASRQTGSADQHVNYMMTFESTYPTLATNSHFHLAPSPILSTQDSGFASRSASSATSPILDIKIPIKIVKRSFNRSDSQSSVSSIKSPIKRRQSSPQSSDVKKPNRVKYATHNDVEKRSRTKLNAKIAELSASVPSLRSIARSDNTSGDENEKGPRTGYPARGLKKATVLSKATDYIRHLESEKGKLENDNAELRKRLKLCGRIAEQEGSEWQRHS